MQLQCRHCSWETDAKHFGYVSKQNDGNNLCMVCYWGRTTLVKDENIKLQSEFIKSRKELDNA